MVLLLSVHSRCHSSCCKLFLMPHHDIVLFQETPLAAGAMAAAAAAAVTQVHVLKNPRSSVHQAAKRLKTRYRYGLSGAHSGSLAVCWLRV